MTSKTKSAQNCYILFNFLWIIVLLPKELQFGAFFLIIAVSCLKSTLAIKHYLKPFLLYAVIHLISIILNYMTDVNTLSRLFAAFNTCGIWVLAILFVGTIDFKKVNLDYVGKVFARNIFILVGILLVTWFFDITSINLGLETRQAWRADWLTTGRTMRFRGFFEFDTLVGLFTILQFPLAFLFFLKYKTRLEQLVLLVATLIPTYATLTRTGIFLLTLEIILAVWFSLETVSLNSRGKLVVKFIIVISMLTLFFALFPDINALINSLINMREGSNTARSNIYWTSVLMTVEKSPFIGIGIKKMLGQFPLGSHCTYIGIFYKTGIIGCIIWFVGLFNMLKMLFSNLWSINQKEGKFIFVSVLLFLCYLFTEDLDGANWLIVMFFCVQEIYLHIKEERQEE